MGARGTYHEQCYLERYLMLAVLYRLHAYLGYPHWSERLILIDCA